MDKMADSTPSLNFARTKEPSHRRHAATSPSTIVLPRQGHIIAQRGRVGQCLCAWGQHLQLHLHSFLQLLSHF